MLMEACDRVGSELARDVHLWIASKLASYILHRDGYQLTWIRDGSIARGVGLSGA
jgi:hypothetical protein